MKRIVHMLREYVRGPKQASARKVTGWGDLEGLLRAGGLVVFWFGGRGRIADYGRRAVDRLAKRLGDQGVVVEIDAEANPDLAACFGVSRLPDMQVYRGGRPAARRVGVWPEQEYDGLVAWALNTTNEEKPDVLLPV